MKKSEEVADVGFTTKKQEYVWEVNEEEERPDLEGVVLLHEALVLEEKRVVLVPHFLLHAPRRRTL